MSLAPGVALISGLFRQFFTDTSGYAFDFGGAFSIIAVHRNEGWKFLSGHTSQPVPRDRYAVAEFPDLFLFLTASLAAAVADGKNR